MASKFQNRLVGTIIIVALGVIVLPGLLDGQKKHFKEEFAAIPLVPKPGDQQESDLVAPVTQSLPAQPPEGAVEAIGHASGENTSQADSGSTVPAANNQPALVSPPPVQQRRPQEYVAPQQQKPVEKVKPRQTEKPVEKVAEKTRQPEKPVEKPRSAEKPQPQRAPVAETATAQPAAPSQPPAAEAAAPTGQAWVVQLGALKNAAKVNEIVAQLRLSGYRAFTVPATPVAGQITRIYVGPDASKAKMQAAIGQLQGISGLGGVVKAWGARQ